MKRDGVKETRRKRQGKVKTSKAATRAERV